MTAIPRRSKFVRLLTPVCHFTPSGCTTSQFSSNSSSTMRPSRTPTYHLPLGCKRAVVAPEMETSLDPKRSNLIGTGPSGE